MRLHQAKRGFTLIEILLVVALIAILAGIVILAINPGKQVAETRNSQRRSDINTILNAVYQEAIDSGKVHANITTVEREVCDTATCTGLADLSFVTSAEKYLVAIPNDPQCPSVCDANGAGYTIVKTTNNRVTVKAPDAEQGATISVTR